MTSPRPKEKKILILGASGLLGKNLSVFLQKRGCAILCHGNSVAMNVNFDLTQKMNTWKSLEEIGPKIIINLVALTDIEKCEEYPDLAYKINVQTLENVVGWIRQKSIRPLLIHISTDQVYNAQDSKENQVVLLNYYSYSKYLSEKVAQSVPSIVLRTNFFGSLVQNTRPSYAEWVLSMLKSRKEFFISDNIYFSPLSILSLAKYIKLVVSNPKVGVYNVGSSDGMSKYSFARYLAVQNNYSYDNMKKLSNMKTLARRPDDMRMDSSLFEKTFNCKMPRLITEIENLQQEGKKYVF